MAKARMLHGKISVSSQVNRLSSQSKLLFSWMIPHADDDGRLKGEPEYIKATVVPMLPVSKKMIKNMLTEISNQQLIYYWEENGEWYIEFVKWKEHQQIRADRYKPSELPSYLDNNDHQVTTNGQPNNSLLSTQYNPIENKDNKNGNKNTNIKNNLREDNPNEIPTFRKHLYGDEKIINPSSFIVTTEREQFAYQTWEMFDKDNPSVFQSVYLPIVDLNIPLLELENIREDVLKDKSLNKPGAVFHLRVMNLIKELKSNP